MGLLTKWKKTKEPIDWSNAYIAMPHFYSKPDGTPFGSFALTEETETVFPIKPQNTNTLDGKKITEWKIALISSTTQNVIDVSDYFEMIKKLDKYVIDSKKDSILVHGLSFEEMNCLIQK